MNIRVDLNYPINDGVEVVFRSPVDCSQVTGLKVYYPENGATASKEFAFADAHGNNVGDIDHLFAENVVVKVILDVTTGMAFVQNADTNAYLERRLMGAYSTTREKLGEAYTDTKKYQSGYIHDLYDELMAKYPNNVRKTTYHIDDGTADGFDNHAYEISTGDYPTDAVYVQQYGNNPPIKKPKYLILSGIHGRERRAVFSTYRFIRDLLSGHNVPQAFREGAIISVIPVGTPSSFDAFTRESASGVNINRNFNAETPEKETQAIMNWLNANADADLLIDVHNNGALNEKVLILGLPNNSISNTARKTALRGVDNIIPYWRDVIKYEDPVKAEGLDGTVKERDVVYSYTATPDMDGISIRYAQNVVGIPSITIELASFYGDHTDFTADMKADSPEAVAMGAEALGNILLEFYKQENMTPQEDGALIYNGEAWLNINTKTHAQYTWEVE